MRSVFFFRKTEERKQELRLREDLKEAEGYRICFSLFPLRFFNFFFLFFVCVIDASQCDLFPQTRLCKCFFFNNLGKLRPKQAGDGSDRRFNDALHRRFLRQGLIILIIIMTDITIFTLNLLTRFIS